MIDSHGSGPGGWKAALVTALRDRARDDRHPCDRICVAVPDTWLDGDEAGAREHEAMRAAVENGHLSDQVLWAGQLSATVAGAIARVGDNVERSYLACDAGGSGIRAGLFTTSQGTVRQVRVCDAPGGGCSDFDSGIRSAIAGEPLPPMEQWFAAATKLSSRATVVLRRAGADDSFRDAPVYERAGLTNALTAGLLLDAFEPTARRLRSTVADALAGTTPDAALLAGGLAWFPSVTDVLSEIVQAPLENLGAEAAVSGTLAYASGQVQMASASYPEVALPAHEIRAGLLIETRLPLSWSSATSKSAPTLMLDGDVVVVDVAGTMRTVHVPGLVPGPYRLGIRPGGAGRALLVLRPDYGPSQNILIGPLDLE